MFIMKPLIKKKLSNRWLQ